MSLFARFLNTFQRSGEPTRAVRWIEDTTPGFAELMSAHGGATFDDGLYRLHTPDSQIAANEWVAEGFPAIAGHVACFGYDWLGRQFALDLRDSARTAILLIEPGTGEVLEIPSTFIDFHNDELVEQQEAALARSFFDSWSRANADLLPMEP